MIIRNNTYEPLAVRVVGEDEDEITLELEPGEVGFTSEEEVEDRFLTEVIIEPSSTPHFVSTMQINGN